MYHISMFMFDVRMISMPSECELIDTKKYQPARHSMKFLTRSLCSLTNKHILAQQADIFGINRFTFR